MQLQKVVTTLARAKAALINILLQHTNLQVPAD
jgi:hypothetical protein